MQVIRRSDSLGQRPPAGNVIGMDMRVDHKADLQPKFESGLQVWLDVGARIHDGANGLAASAENVGCTCTVGVEDLTK